MTAPTFITAASPFALPTVATNDLLVSVLYAEPNNETGSSASYGTIAEPAGFATWPGSPINSNDAHMTSQSTNRCYLAYKWATGSESGTSPAWSFDGVVQTTDYGGQNNGDYGGRIATFAIRGATDTTGGHSGAPNVVQSTAGQLDTPNHSTLPSVSVSAPANSLCVFVSTSWNTEAITTPASWTSEASSNNFNLGQVFIQTPTSAGTVTIAPAYTGGSVSDYSTSWLFAITAATASVPTSQFFPFIR